MDIAKAMVLVALALPSVAVAQVSYSRAWIAPGRPVGSICAEREDILADRKASLDREKMDNDAELAAIDREGAELEGELRALDRSNTAAVEDYNARSDAHNRRVAAHNRRVANMNAAAGDFSAELSDAAQYCSSRGWTWTVR